MIGKPTRNWPTPGRGLNFQARECQTPWTAKAEHWLQAHGVEYRVINPEGHTDTDRLAARLDSVATWYSQDWMKLDPKLRTSCVEGISSFLSLFDMEDVAAIFCPKAPPRSGGGNEAGNGDARPRCRPPECGSIFQPWMS